MLTVTHGVRVRSDARCAPRLSPSATMTSQVARRTRAPGRRHWSAAVRTKTCSTFASICRGPFRPRSTGKVAGQVVLVEVGRRRPRARTRAPTRREPARRGRSPCRPARRVPASRKACVRRPPSARRGRGTASPRSSPRPWPDSPPSRRGARRHPPVLSTGDGTLRGGPPRTPAHARISATGRSRFTGNQVAPIAAIHPH